MIARRPGSTVRPCARIDLAAVSTRRLGPPPAAGEDAGVVALPVPRRPQSELRDSDREGRQRYKCFVRGAGDALHSS